MKKYYLVYVTANDTLFFKDYINLFFTRKFDPGVGEVQLYFVVGCVKKNSWFQNWMLHAILTMARGGPYIRSKALIIKDNRGWDFGSAAEALKQIGSEANAEDFIMVRNRSTWGPLFADWYQIYVDRLLSSDQIALAGSTIGLNDHPKRKRSADVAHVQTFVYVSQWKYLSTLLPDYPGGKATNHLEAVLQGEIDLSQQVMKKGWRLASLKYPELVLDASNQNAITHDQLKSFALGKSPIHKDNHPRTLKYYFKILLILTTLIRYVIPRKRSYERISLLHQS